MNIQRARRRAAAAVLVLAAALPVAAHAACTPDTNGDLQVDGADLVNVILAWGTNDPITDLNDDDIVDGSDLVIVILSWGPCFESGVFPASWISGGPDCGTEPEIQVHQYNSDLYILRQSLCTNFEAPFMYLLFGDDKVLLQDTGAGGVQIADTVYGIIDQWLADHGKTSIELVVTHSHSHGDHTAGDAQFIGQPSTTVVGTSVTAVAQFFGILNWPIQTVPYDLGNRVVDVIPIPGHHPAHIALYDRRTGILFTGDTLYPGRLYIFDFPAYLASITRLVQLAEYSPVIWVLGTHIEMSNTPGVDFPLGSTHHPDEHPLQLTHGHLIELWDGVTAMQAAPFIEVHDEFIIWPF